jgi:hypothetical protein
VAINCHRNDKVYYRKVCDVCARAGKKLKPTPPAWYKSGYRKKPVCEKCGFRSKYTERQMSVFYVDGNMKNNTAPNLKSVCLNCRVELAQSRSGWREAPLTPDF